MTETRPYITDAPLPLNQDFKALKEKGLEFIQSLNGTEWTNFNPSDPGVTILEQLCFALTELGYCADFPIEDILATEDGSLQIKEQFYLPDEILTTAPITINDYRKLLIDALPLVFNALVIPVQTPVSLSKGIHILDKVYQVYLYTDPDTGNSLPTCRAAYFLLNRQRNLNESFLVPRLLLPQTHQLYGRVYIHNPDQMSEILRAMQDRINQYIFPKVSQTGTAQMEAEGFTTDEIYNGPVMEHGWISDHELGPKRDQLTVRETSSLLSSISGIIRVTDLAFDASTDKGNISCKYFQRLVVEIEKSFRSDHLEFYCQGRKITFGEVGTPQLPPEQWGASRPVIPTSRQKPDYPQGKYRDIESYYSVQNTFPASYGIGPYAIENHSSSFKMAQSRQLQGYLTLFDQVLANEFSQLAHVKELFSFRNADSAAPRDRDNYLARRGKLAHGDSPYPAPYSVFSPTYFFQSLYEIPYIQGVLKDFQADNLGPVPGNQASVQAWNKYQDDPYNAYFRGLSDIMESPEERLMRRNTMLDHLLARNGESPALLAPVISGSVYSGNSLQDQVIIKSLLLQNLGTLTYNRSKARNFLMARELYARLEPVPQKWIEKGLTRYRKDFVFDSDSLDKLSLITERDLTDFSSVELKMNLLLGLKEIYEDFILNNYEIQEKQQEVDQAYWMIQQLKGVVLLEENLLVRFACFQLECLDPEKINRTLRFETTINFTQLISILTHFQEMDPKLLQDRLRQRVFPVPGHQYQLIEQEVDGTAFFFSKGDFQLSLRTSWKRIGKSTLAEHTLDPGLDLIFPAFIPRLNSPEFRSRIRLFLENAIPVHVPYRCFFIGTEMLKELIPLYVEWHNALRYNPQKKSNKGAQEAAARLIGWLSLLNIQDHGHQQ